MANQRITPQGAKGLSARPVPPPVFRPSSVLQRQVPPGQRPPSAVVVPPPFKPVSAVMRPPVAAPAPRPLAVSSVAAVNGKIQAAWAAIAAAPAVGAAAAPVVPVGAAPAAVPAIPAAAQLTTSAEARSHFGDLRTNPDGLPTSTAELREYVIDHWDNFVLRPDGNYRLGLGEQSTRRRGGGYSERTWSIVVDGWHIFHYGPSS